MTDTTTRRDLLRGATAVVSARAVSSNGPLAVAGDEAAVRHRAAPFRLCLNTSTISGQKLPLPDVIDIAAKAGYDAIEPWLREIEQFVKDGGSTKDLAKRVSDAGLTVESAIGFSAWIVDDDAARAKAVEETKRAMDLVRQIGGTRIAAPPVGATDKTGFDLLKAAERYRDILDAGDAIGVVPQVEVWGFSKTLGRLGEAMLVAFESGHRKACVLPDVFHLYKGGSNFAGLCLLGPETCHVIHVNDYPADPPRETITDAQRVYPGDGVAPLAAILRDLRAAGFHGALSLELFNRDYWKEDALAVARTGIEKLKRAVASIDAN